MVTNPGMKYKNKMNKALANFKKADIESVLNSRRTGDTSYRIFASNVENSMKSGILINGLYSCGELKINEYLIRSTGKRIYFCVKLGFRFDGMKYNNSSTTYPYSSIDDFVEYVMKQKFFNLRNQLDDYDANRVKELLDGVSLEACKIDFDKCKKTRLYKTVHDVIDALYTLDIDVIRRKGVFPDLDDLEVFPIFYFDLADESINKMCGIGSKPTPKTKRVGDFDRYVDNIRDIARNSVSDVLYGFGEFIDVILDTNSNLLKQDLLTEIRNY